MDATKIFVNLPVKDIARSRAFWEKLGYRFNPKFSDEKAACMIVSDDINVMFLAEPYFASFTTRPVADAWNTTGVLLALSQPSREAVDRFASEALAAGAREYRPPQDYGFMYQRSIEDLDGHVWEHAWMDPKAAEEGPPAA